MLHRQTPPAGVEPAPIVNDCIRVATGGIKTVLPRGQKFKPIHVVYDVVVSDVVQRLLIKIEDITDSSSIPKKLFLLSYMLTNFITLTMHYVMTYYYLNLPITRTIL